jgi:pimeloyl-ACP methyl ester carboxylesterase
MARGNGYWEASRFDFTGPEWEASRQHLQETLRLQAEGIYPAAFAAIKVPFLMIRGKFDPLPGRLILEVLRPYLPQLEYRELQGCGHYP